MEVWKDVKGYEGRYKISNEGVLISLVKSKPIIMKQPLNTHGYKIVRLSLNGKSRTRTVHQLVAEAFLNHTPCGYKLIVDHIDNDRLNNNSENLQITSQRRNTSKDRKNKTSKYTGVCMDRGKWRAAVWCNGRDVLLGRFDCEIEAKEAYCSFIKSIKI